jgi:hypothetical protein
VDPRASLDDVEKRDSNSDPSIVQPVAILCTDYAIPARIIHHMALDNSVTCSADLAYVHGRDMPRVKYKTIR